VASFPVLKTGAVAQYPAARAQTFSTACYRFLDGSEQRFRHWPGALHQWVIRLDLLDEDELAAVEQFFLAQGGRSGLFSFTDPFDGAVYPHCRFAADQLEMKFDGSTRNGTSIVVMEQRS
jgi:hypothetical protein